MKSSCPTSLYIHQVAQAAAGLGEPSCDILVGGVRVTVHVPLEGPLQRKVAVSMLRLGEFQVTHGHLNLVGVTGAKPTRLPVLVFGWTGSGFTPAHHSLN
jgi:hypothetical protein